MPTGHIMVVAVFRIVFLLLLLFLLVCYPWILKKKYRRRWRDRITPRFEQRTRGRQNSNKWLLGLFAQSLAICVFDRWRNERKKTTNKRTVDERRFRASSTSFLIKPEYMTDWLTDWLNRLGLLRAAGLKKEKKHQRADPSPMKKDWMDGEWRECVMTLTIDSRDCGVNIIHYFLEHCFVFTYIVFFFTKRTVCVTVSVNVPLICNERLHIAHTAYTA